MPSLRQSKTLPMCARCASKEGLGSSIWGKKTKDCARTRLDADFESADENGIKKARNCFCQKSLKKSYKIKCVSPAGEMARKR